MTPAEKGRRYSHIFRKVGVFLGKSKIARALDSLKKGQALAEREGDTAMARRFADEIARVERRPPAVTEE